MGLRLVLSERRTRGSEREDRNEHILWEIKMGDDVGEGRAGASLVVAGLRSFLCSSGLGNCLGTILRHSLAMKSATK